MTKTADSEHESVSFDRSVHDVTATCKCGAAATVAVGDEHRWWRDHASQPYARTEVHTDTGGTDVTEVALGPVQWAADASKTEARAAAEGIAEEDAVMTRDEAISHIRGLSLSVEGEFCVGKGESDALEAETTAALMALGVTTAELDADQEATP